MLENKVLFSNNNSIAEITLNNVKKHNSLEKEMILEIIAFLKSLDESTKVVLLTGNGKNFCAGADLNSIFKDLDYVFLLKEMLLLFDNVKVPLLVYLHGAAIGAGVQLALCADIVVMNERSYISIPAVKYGIALDKWTFRTMLCRTNEQFTNYVFYTGEKVLAADCEKNNFIFKIEEFIFLKNIAKSISQNKQALIKFNKKILKNKSPSSDFNPSENMLFFKLWDEIKK